MTGPTAPSPEAESAGQAVYSRRVLRLYDPFVLGFSNRFVWKCPTWRLRAHYDTHVGAEHLDVGVGTGYFLDRCRFPSPAPRLVLLDLNRTCLEVAARRVARYAPETIQASVLRPLPPIDATFDSIGLGYLLHCLPGAMVEKARAFDHLGPLLSPGGVLFGATILGRGVKRGWTARRLMRTYNRKGIFSNRFDDLETLRSELEARFTDVRTELFGCVCLFSARNRPLSLQSTTPGP